MSEQNEQCIFYLMWGGVILLLWLYGAYKYGKDEDSVVFGDAWPMWPLLWPVIIAVLVAISPLLGVWALGRRHRKLKPKPKPKPKVPSARVVTKRVRHLNEADAAAQRFSLLELD